MSPRSLLFSSSQETSRPLIQALEELELGVEYCPEIFATIEELTSRGFDAIVADLDDGPEAEFLLKTARELKVSQNAFVLAVTGKMPHVAAKHSQADLVLTKPISSDQVKYALLACDRFLACMRTWIGKRSSATALKPPLPRLDAAPATPKVRSVNTMLAALPPKPSPTLAGATAPSRLTSPDIDSPRVRVQHHPAMCVPRWGSRPRPKGEKHLRSKSLWAASLGVVLALSACAFPYRSEGKRILTRVLQVSEKAYERAAESGEDQLREPENVGSKNPEVIRVATSHAHDPAEPGPARVQVSPVIHREAPDLESRSVPEKHQADANPIPDHAAVAAAFVAIPQSMKIPQPGADTPRDFPGKPSPSLLGELEPVLLSEDASQRQLIEKVEPSYPAQALKAGLQGSVVLQAWIATDGSMQDLKLVSGSLLLGQAAYEAVKHWRYKPFLRDGKAVTAQTYVTVNFRLPQQSLLSYPH